MTIWNRLKRRFSHRLQAPRPVQAARLPDIVYNDFPDLQRFVFICGLHRSGTTLLERMLVARFDLSCLRADVPESEGQHMQSVYRAALHFGGPGRFAFSREMRAELDRLGHPDDCHARLLADWSRFVVGDSPTLVEKSPPNLTKIHWLRKVFPGSRFVIMTRDPRAASAATQKWAEGPLSELMRHWHEAYSQAVADFREQDCTVIRYEDLCERPDAEIDRVASFLELAPRAASGSMEGRYRELKNSNEEYVAMHGDQTYGPGIWRRFGYSA